MCMYICDNCGDVVDIEDLPTFTEKHPYGETYAEETFINFDCACGGEYQKAEQCERCGEYVLETDEGLCDVCRSDLYDE